MKAYRGRTGALAVALLSALALLALTVTMAAAHTTEVTHSDPADGSIVTKSPDQVVAQYSEELDTTGSTIRVMDAAGRQVSDGDGQVDLDDADHKIMIAAIGEPLASGEYTVAWHAVLTDGDASDGTFKFTVNAVAGLGGPAGRRDRHADNHSYRRRPRLPRPPATAGYSRHARGLPTTGRNGASHWPGWQPSWASSWSWPA